MLFLSPPYYVRRALVITASVHLCIYVSLSLWFLTPLKLRFKCNPTYTLIKITLISSLLALLILQNKLLILEREINELYVIQIRLCNYTWNIIKCHLRHLLIGISVWLVLICRKVQVFLYIWDYEIVCLCGVHCTYLS